MIRRRKSGVRATSLKRQYVSFAAFAALLGRFGILIKDFFANINMDLLNRFVLLETIQSNSGQTTNILFRLSQQRQLYIGSVVGNPDGSASVTVYDGHLFEADGSLYCISNWKYRDLREPDGPTTEAVWEKTAPWILECGLNDQFMCKHVLQIRISNDDRVEMKTWRIGGYEILEYSDKGISACVAEASAENEKTYLTIIVEIINQCISLSESTVAEIIDDLPKH